LGTLGAFAAAIFSAFGRITYRYLATQESAFAIVLYLNGILALVTLPIALAFGSMGSVMDFWPVLLMGPIAALGQLCNVRAYALQEASFLAPVQYSGLIFSGLIGYFIFAEIPTVQSFIGMGLILLGAAIVLYVKAHPRRLKL
ncbi:MAG: DMT family transporter, partial [Alphaproteobacteria bacterium]|nr:DMT family transporter [Alphaproteobacteria bacterium]